jgi:hypothetical protein
MGKGKETEDIRRAKNTTALFRTFFLFLLFQWIRSTLLVAARRPPRTTTLGKKAALRLSIQSISEVGTRPPAKDFTNRTVVDKYDTG